MNQKHFFRNMTLPEARRVLSICLWLCVVGVVFGDDVPTHSWATLPVFGWFGNSSGPFSNEAINFAVDHYDLITIPKFQSKDMEPVNKNCEKKIIDAAKQFKKKKSSMKIMFYANGAMCFNFCQACEYILQNHKNDWILHDEKGNIVYLSDGSNKEPVYDLSNPDMRNFWIEVVINATNTGQVDGVFVDRGQANANQFKDVSSNKKKAWNSGYAEMLADCQTKLGNKLVFVNNHDFNDVNGRTFEKFGGDNDFDGDKFNADVRALLAENTTDHIWVEVHGEPNATSTYQRSLAAFLTCAPARNEGGSYYSSTSGWHIDDGWLIWPPDYDKKLGNPITDTIITETNNFNIYQRNFSSGTYATLHTKKSGGSANDAFGCVYWSDGTVTGGSKC